ncbi:uroporphyrinogen decarboxylase family protein [Allisonella histaminiformans]|uniref:uroporphyrinogen decarboxylase family protein n=1 Tax=Allisonella histaminiformans TaxID=209880 RepID=UPI0026ED0565|nr:uroporphyrinogen decarboxylase family protein [Allisonella histaminiformans]
MIKRELIESVIAGEPVTRIPCMFWQTPSMYTCPEEQAEKTAAFYEHHDSDIIKINNILPIPVSSTGRHVPDEKTNLSMGSVNHGPLHQQLQVLKSFIPMKKDSAPVLFTVLSPLSSAAAMYPHLLTDASVSPSQKEELLTDISERTCSLVRTAVEAGADGIFFITTLASYDALSPSLYRKYGFPYDIAVLSSSPGWCNILHAEGKEIMFPLLRKYPVQFITRNAPDSLQGLKEMAALSQKSIIGGLSLDSLSQGRRDYLEHEVYMALKETQGKRLIISPGTALPDSITQETTTWLKHMLAEFEHKLLR